LMEMIDREADGSDSLEVSHQISNVTVAMANSPRDSCSCTP
jgi:hypothetical protein